MPLVDNFAAIAEDLARLKAEREPERVRVDMGTWVVPGAPAEWTDTAPAEYYIAPDYDPA